MNVDATGRILSWGNSFHPSSAAQPTHLEPVRETANTEHCQHLTNLVAELSPSETGPWSIVKSAAKAALGLGGDEAVTASPQFKHVSHHLGALCRPPLDSSSMLTPIDALTHILPTLNPSAQPIDSETLSSHAENTFAPKSAPAEPPTEHISGPGLATAGVVNPVPARLVYTQVDSGVPRLVWKFEIEMQDNWYEAYVDTFSGEIVRIVDWASDISWTSNDMVKGGKQKPLPVPHKHYKEYSYGVFPFGKLILPSN